MTEEIDACPPRICTVLSCIKDVIRESGYSVGSDCGKSSVSINTWISKLNDGKRRGSSCGRVQVEAVLIVHIDVGNCSDDSCLAAVTHEKIKQALEHSKSECCASIKWRETEINPDFHAQSESWTDVYTLSFLT